MSVDHLREIMRRLRDPEGGCPWDLKQDFASIAPYTIEEAYEVEDAIARADWDGLTDELGDVLLQVVYHSQMGEEAGLFTFEQVATSVCEKMVRRHPHVFGNESMSQPAEVKQRWEEIKASERAARRPQHGDDTPSLMDSIPLGLPALTRAVKLQKRAARVGFDWDNVDRVFDKLDEEIGELKAELGPDADHDRCEDELGDLLFVVANLARHLQVDPEKALRRANRKFASRFQAMEAVVGYDSERMKSMSLDALEALWQQAKVDTGNT